MVWVLALHLIVLLLAMLFAIVGVRKNRRITRVRMVSNIWYVISFLLLFFFLASRVNLGRDWNNYLDLYRDALYIPFSFSESFEFGFLIILKFLRSLNADFQWFIIISSLITLLLFYRSFRKFYYLLPYGILIFFTQWGYPVAINTIRQAIAIFAFMCAVTYIGSTEKHALLKYLSFIFIGCLFHYTVLLFIPVYWVRRFNLTLPQLLVAIGIVFILSFFLIAPLFNDVLALFAKYSYSMDSYYSKTATFGLGASIVLAARIFPLLVYPYVRKRFPRYSKYYLLYYIGLAVYYAFFKYLMIVRVTFYFQFLEMVVMSLFLYITLHKAKKYGMCNVAFLVLNFVYYFYTFRDFLADQLVSSDFSLMLMNFHYGS